MQQHLQNEVSQSQAADLPLQLMELPVELILHILSFVGVAGLGKFEQASKECLMLGRDPALWRANYVTHFQNVYEVSDRNRRKRHLSNDWQKNFKLARCQKQNHEGRDAFYQAIMHDDVNEALRLKHRHNLGINTRDLDYRTPVHIACLHGASQCLKWLIAEGALFQLRKDGSNNTVFHSAAMGGHVLFIPLLLAAASHILPSTALSLINNDRMTALDVAAQEGHEQMVRILSRHGATLDGAKSNTRREICHYPIHHAIIHGHLQVIKAILELYPAMIGKKNSMGNYPFHLCVLYRQYSILEWLITAPILCRNYVIGLQDANGHTAAQLASQMNDVRAMTLLGVQSQPQVSALVQAPVPVVSM